MGIERKTTEFKEITIESSSPHGSISGVLSSFGHVDSYNDRVLSGAYKVTIPQFIQRGFLSWSHAWDVPIGTINDAKEVKDGLYLAADFHGTDAAQQARQITAERLSRQKTMGLSIGYEAVKSQSADDGVRELQEIKLYEAGLVMVPADSFALVSYVKAALDADAYKGALPYVETKAADPETPWDSAAALDGCDGRTQLRAACAWADPDSEPDAKSTYKLPHHEPDGTVILKGVEAAMATLLGARGGVAIPDADRRAVYGHLAKHYQAFHVTPPEYRTAQPLADHAQRVLTELEAFGERCQEIRELRAKEGRVLSRATITRLKDVHQAHAAVGEMMASMIADHQAEQSGYEAEQLYAAYLQTEARLRGVPV